MADRFLLLTNSIDRLLLGNAIDGILLEIQTLDTTQYLRQSPETRLKRLYPDPNAVRQYPRL